MAGLSERALSDRYRAVVDRVRSAAGVGDVTLIAVSKTHPPEAIRELYKLGQRHFAENYVQELVEKAEALKADCPKIRWHFIGHLQTNKVKQLVPWVHAVHSVDSAKLAHELAKRWAAAGREGRLPVFVEVNVEGEASKSGIAPGELPALLDEIGKLPELEAVGLMCIPSSEGGLSGEAFRRLRALGGPGEYSMGMTQDFEVAIREGATHVRVGTAIFGKRA